MGTDPEGDHSDPIGDDRSRLTRQQRWRFVITGFVILGLGMSVAITLTVRESRRSTATDRATITALEQVVAEQQEQLDLICQTAKGQYYVIDGFLRDFRGYIEALGTGATEALKLFDQAIEDNLGRLDETPLPGCTPVVRTGG